MACSSQLYGNILPYCGKNRGGIKRIWLCPKGTDASGNEAFHVESVTLVDQTSLPKDISYMYDTGNSWVEFSFRKGTANFTSTLNRDEANGVQFYTTEINMAFSRMETQKRLAIASLALTEVIAVVEDANGTYWGFGNEEDGVVLSANTGETGTAKTDTNGYTLTLSVDSDALPFELGETAVEVFKGIIGK